MRRYAVFGAGNIGFGVPERLAAEVCLFDMKRPVSLASLDGHAVSFTEVDATDESSLEAAMSFMEAESLDGAILTVGISSPKNASEDMEAFRKTINVIFFGNILPIRVHVKHRLFRKPARIVVVASTSGHFAGISTSGYAPSNWMLINACQSIRPELEGMGITLDIVNPRTIRNVRSDVLATGRLLLEIKALENSIAQGMDWKRQTWQKQLSTELTGKKMRFIYLEYRQGCL